MKFIILMVWFVSGVFCRAQVLLSTNNIKLVRYDNLKQSCGCFLNESEQRFFFNILAQLRSNKSIGAEAEGRLLPVLPVQPRSFTYWSYDSSRDDLERHYLPFSDNGRSTEYSADLSVEKAMVDLAGRIEARRVNEKRRGQENRSKEEEWGKLDWVLKEAFTNEVKLVRYDNLKQSCGCFLNESEQRFFFNILAQLRSNKSIGAEAEGRLLPVLPVQPRSFTYWSYDSSRDDLERHYLPFSDNGRSTEYSADLSVEKAMVDLAGRIEARKN